MKELLAEYSHDPQAQKVIRTLFTTTDSVFLTGCAGTGKTRLLGRIKETISKKFILLAPNGLSAINSGGQTIHSFFRLPQRTFMPEDEEIPMDPELIPILEQTELIVIDDVSMVRADLMNAIDLSLRKHLDSSIPFAGRQLLLVGDLFQAPPPEEPTGLYPTKYFFSAPAFTSYPLWVIELNHSYRYSDSLFFEILRKMRTGQPAETALRELNSRVNPDFLQNEESPGILLALSNLTVDRINSEKYAELAGEEQVLQAVETGVFADYAVDPGCPAERILRLKPESRVVFIRDDPDGRWVNGTAGRILGISDDALEILVGPDELHQVVERVSWSAWEYGWDSDNHCIQMTEAGTLLQFPVRPAWAVNLKGAHNQVFEIMGLDLGSGAFLHGQAYQAISRCTSLAHLTLRTLIQAEDFITDPAVTGFMAKEATSGNEEKLWSLLLDHAGEDHVKTISFQHAQLAKLQETNAGLTMTLEAARQELIHNKEKERILNESFKEIQELVLRHDEEKASLLEDLEALEKKVRNKDRWINFLLIIQLVFFIAVLGVVVLKIL